MLGQAQGDPRQRLADVQALLAPAPLGQVGGRGVAWGTGPVPRQAGDQARQWPSDLIREVRFIKLCQLMLSHFLITHQLMLSHFLITHQLMLSRFLITQILEIIFLCFILFFCFFYEFVFFGATFNFYWEVTAKGLAKINTVMYFF